MKRSLILTLFTMIMLKAFAHEVRPAYLEMHQTGTGYL